MRIDLSAAQTRFDRSERWDRYASISTLVSAPLLGALTAAWILNDGLSSPVVQGVAVLLAGATVMPHLAACWFRDTASSTEVEIVRDTLLSRWGMDVPRYDLLGVIGAYGSAVMVVVLEEDGFDQVWMSYLDGHLHVYDLDEFEILPRPAIKNADRSGLGST